MAVDTLNVKRHDLQPTYKFAITDSAGATVDCTGATARFSMSSDGGTTLKVSRATCTWTSAATGVGYYQWAGTDTNTVGKYSVEIEVTPLVGGPFTVPVEEKAYVRIYADIDNA